MFLTFNPDVDNLIADTDVYTVIDNTYLDSMTISQTILHNGMSTRGHSHNDQDEIYIFLAGHGLMFLTDTEQKDVTQYIVKPGTIIGVTAGYHHRVFNNSRLTDDLRFLAIFPKQRLKA